MGHYRCGEAILDRGRLVVPVVVAFMENTSPGRVSTFVKGHPQAYSALEA
jgi:hypothetical protein